MAPNHISRFARWVTEECRKSFSLARRDIRIIAALAALIPPAYFVDIHIGESEFNTILLRAAVFVFVASLWFLKAPSPRAEALAAVYFVLVATLALPFMFGAMLIVNAALMETGQELNQLWSLQYLVAMFIFIQVIHGKILSVLLWLTSLLLCGFSLFSLDAPNYQEIQKTLIQSSACFMTAMIFGLITNRSADFIEKEKLAAASAIGSYIAHEIRTPLATIRSLARSASRATEEARRHPGSDSLLDKNLKKISAAIPEIIREVEFSNTLIDMLLLNTKEYTIVQDYPSRHSAKELITEALHRFPFSSEREKQAVTLDISADFSVAGDGLLLTHVFFNLIKNAVFFMQRRPGGRVFITTRPGGRFNSVEVTDTGQGISRAVKSRIFERFFTTLSAGQGAGIGLSFCKSVMEGLGGQILCESKEGEYTTFRLLFPHPKSGTSAPHSG